MTKMEDLPKKYYLPFTVLKTAKILDNRSWLEVTKYIFKKANEFGRMGTELRDLDAYTKDEWTVFCCKIRVSEEEYESFLYKKDKKKN